jgi:excisionase family DNA binding protein
MTPVKYLTPAEAAAKRGVDTVTVLRMCHRGEIPGALAPQKSWRIPASSVKLIPKRGKGERGKDKGARKKPAGRGVSGKKGK